MNPNDFQTFPICDPNPNEPETNPNLPYSVSVSLIRLIRNHISILSIIKIQSDYPGESFGLKFIPNQTEIFRKPEFVSAPYSFIPI